MARQLRAYAVRRHPAAGGSPTTRVVLARDAEHARRRVLDVPGELVVTTPLPASPRWLPPRAPSAAALRDAYAELSTCLAVDGDLGGALRTTVGLVSNDRLNAALADLLAAIEAGTPPETALGTLEGILPPDHVAQWRAGLAAGRLPEVLRQLEQALGRETVGLRKLRQAIAYPLLVLAGAAVVGWQSAHQQAPVVASMFKALGAEVPAATRVLLAGDALLVAHPVLAVGTAGVAAKLLASLPAAWRRGGVVTTVVDRIAPVRRLLFRLSLARSLRTLSLLLRSGSPLQEALLHAALAADHPRLGPFWTAIRRDLVELGRPPLDSALARAGTLGQDGERLVALLRLGERSGEFAPLAERLAALSEEDAQASLAVVQTLAAPVGLALAGVVLAFLILATIVPLSQLSTVVLR